MIENMKAFMESKSINNENTPFVQVRHDAGGNMMHLQVCSLLVKGNRDYGYAGRQHSGIHRNRRILIQFTCVGQQGVH